MPIGTTANMFCWALWHTPLAKRTESFAALAYVVAVGLVCVHAESELVVERWQSSQAPIRYALLSCIGKCHR